MNFLYTLLNQELDKINGGKVETVSDAFLLAGGIAFGFCNPVVGTIATIFLALW